MLRVLVIDIDAGVLEAVKRLLEGDDCELCVAGDAYSGMELAESLHPEIIISSARASGIDGIEVVRHLKELDPDAEIIVVADDNEGELGIEVLDAGASGFVTRSVMERGLRIAFGRSKEKVWMRGRLQEAIEEIQKRYDFEHKLIQTSMDGIIANDRRGKIIVFNEGASRIYGYSQQEALSTLHVTRLYPEGEARRIKKTIYGPQYGGPGRLINYEALALTREEGLTPILLSATLIHDGDVEVATVGYFKDLTELKRRTSGLIAAGEAVSDMGREVKDALYGMQLGAYLLEKEMAGVESEGLRKGWRLMSENLEHISRLMLDLLSRKGRDAGRCD